MVLVMKKSVEQQLLDFLAANPSKWASVYLEKKEWKNKNGSSANPRTIIRRLQENTYWETDTPQHKKNLNGILIATYENNTTYYQIKEGHEKKECKIVQCFDETGRPFIREVFA